VYLGKVLGFRLDSESKDKPSNLLLRSLTQYQELYWLCFSTVTAGCNVAGFCLDWMFGLGCPSLHKQISNWSMQNRSCRYSDCTVATNMTVQTWPLEIDAGLPPNPSLSPFPSPVHVPFPSPFPFLFSFLFPFTSLPYSAKGRRKRMDEGSDKMKKQMNEQNAPMTEQTVCISMHYSCTIDCG